MFTQCSQLGLLVYGMGHWYITCVTNVLQTQSQPLLRANWKKAVLAIWPFPYCQIVPDMIVCEFVSEVKSRVMLKSRHTHFWPDLMTLAVWRGDRWIPKLLCTCHLSPVICHLSPALHCLNSKLSNIRHEDFRLSGLCPSVTLRLPHLDSETGWTGELWTKYNLLKWHN